jgi:DEAD/DEAH box helicase domain-containing protein
LLQAAARDHLPLDPSVKAKVKEAVSSAAVPESKDRPTIDAVIEEVQQQSWYREQILERRVFDEKEGRTGEDLG